MFKYMGKFFVPCSYPSHAGILAQEMTESRDHGSRMKLVGSLIFDNVTQVLVEKNQISSYDNSWDMAAKIRVSLRPYASPSMRLTRFKSAKTCL